MPVETASDKPSSIEVSKNAKGDYAFKVKVYFEGFDHNMPPTYGIHVSAVIQTIYKDLLKRFK